MEETTPGPQPTTRWDCVYARPAQPALEYSFSGCFSQYFLVTKRGTMTR